MNIIEFLIDTKHKRVALMALIFSIMLLKEAICNIFFVLPVLSFTTLESLYSLIPYAEYSFVGRLLYSLYSMTSINVPYILMTIFKSFSLSMIISFILSIYYVIVGYQDYIFKVTRRLSFVSMILIVFIYIGALIMILSNLTILTTYHTILDAVHLVSLWLLVSHGVYAVIVLCFMYFVVREYIEALEYKAIELEQ
ncbi:MAG: hypothetical protein IKM20_06665 [Erysipelotrichales bacterium]|nr:hypothetical protein [Erysipelotrichales bacterium]